MKFLYPCFLIPSIALLSGCIGNMNPAGGNGRPNYPYFITTQPMIIKKINVPAGTILTYEKQSFKTGKQNQLMNENKLQSILMPSGQNIIWGGVPVSMIEKFFNSQMRGYSVHAEFEKLSPSQSMRFSKLWKSCSDHLGITIKNNNDWSFNLNNIADVENCSVLYQRYFKHDTEQQQFLDQLYRELKKVNLK
ncbi:hypothetical protein [Acinetobacter bereziniae]|uniref:hypothetical protein n=1 Tax=Acinetobacter bereziniae TaxID=106648 RepID=UPI00190233E4|nr:hypothetical protein [Acinetobacter bereziniae]MBJ8444017.1 hypothetical protein [Acinetobacter bereziniae]